MHFSPLFSSSSKKKSSLREVTNTHNSNNNVNTNEEEKEEKNNGLKSSSLELKYRATVALFQTHSNAFEELQRKLAVSERDVKRETNKSEALAQELESKKEELEALKETLETAQNQENTWRTQKESETFTMRTKVDELKQKFETNVEETQRAMASMEIERVEFEGEMRRAKASEREAKAEAESLRRRLDSKETETKEKEEKVVGLEEDVGRLKEALLERRKTQEDVEHALRETKKKCARLEGELRGRRQTRKNGGFSNGSSPAAANTTSTPSLTLATTSSTSSHDNAYATTTTTTTTGERPPWDDSFHASANRGGAPASSMMRPIAFPDTPMSSSTAHRSTSAPPNTNINNNNNRRNNDDELRDAFRHVKAFGQEIAHSWRERATRAENHREQLERNVKAINAKLVDEQLKNVKLLDELKITKATIVRLEAENATKESDQSSARKECERLSALLNEVNERNASIETVCKKHRDSALDASKRVSAAESILDALKAKEREAFRLRELSEQRLNICERELRAMSSELEKAKEHAWKMVEVQELTMRRAELAEKKLVEITTNNKMSTMNNGLGGKFSTEEAASPSIDAWIKTPTNGQTLMTPSITRGGPTWTRTPLRKVA
jgi:chromosome segregation ATPase